MTLLVTAYGVLTPVFVLWQVQIVLQHRLVEARYQRVFVDRSPFPEHI